LESLPGGPLLAALGEPLFEKAAAEWRRNASTVLAVACRRAGRSREDLEELIDQDPRLIPLVTRALFAAGMSGQDRVLSLLGGFLGDAFSDLSRTEEVATFLAAVSTLTEHHIKVLELLEMDPGTASALPDLTGQRWTTGLLVHCTDMREELTLAAVQGLFVTGFAADVGLDGGTVAGGVDTSGTKVALTGLGEAVLEALREVTPE